MKYKLYRVLISGVALLEKVIRCLELASHFRKVNPFKSTPN